MAHSLSSKKRSRQNEVRRTRNRTRKAALKTEIRKLTDLLHGGDVAGAEKQFRVVTKKLDQVSAKSTMHKNTAARKKSRLAKRLNAVKAKKATAASGA